VICERFLKSSLSFAFKFFSALVEVRRVCEEEEEEEEEEDHRAWCFAPMPLPTFAR